MASRTWTLNKDTTTAGGAVDYGNGNDQHAPIGLWSGWTFRHFAKYNVDVSGMASISAATLHIRSSDQHHCAFGSSPTVKARRVTANWVGSGGAEGSFSGSADPKRSTEPSTTATGETSTVMTETENTWDTLSVTAIAQAWLAGSTNYGIRLASSDETSTSKTWEGMAQASSYDSYIVVTYVPVSTATAPTATPVDPTTGDVAVLAYTAESGWTSPRPTVTWAFTDPDAGAAQSAYQVLVYNDSGGSPSTTLYDSGKVTSSATSLQIPATFVEGSYYHWKVQVWDNTDLVSTAYTTAQRFRTRWGEAEYIADLTSTPLSWELITVLSAGNVVVEYNSSSAAGDPGAGLGTWRASLSAVTKQRYLRYRVWLLPGTAVPSLDKIVFSYSTAALPFADNWTASADATIDSATRVYGTRSLSIAVAGTDEATYQKVVVLPNTTYQLSGRIKQSAIGTNPYLSLNPTATVGSAYVSVDGSSVSTDWTQVSVSWDSGALTEVYVQCGASGTGTAWFDALKMEASVVVTQWAPAAVGGAAIVDSSGVKIDASLGGTLRLLGSAGGTRDTVAIGTNGLLLGGDVLVSTPAAGQIALGDTSINSGSTAFPASPATNDRFWRSDLGMEFYFNGTRWLSVEVFQMPIPGGQRVGQAISATIGSNAMALTGQLEGGSDIYLLHADISVQVVTGGTALSASHKWVVELIKGQNGTLTEVIIATFNIDSGASAVWRTLSVAINALQNAGTVYDILYANFTKTGTPGSLFAGLSLSYRIVAT